MAADAPTCDPATTPDRCVGSVVEYCDGLVHDVDCGALGQECVLVNGHAGCQPSKAAACSGFTDTCADSTTLLACCPSNGWYNNLPCIPGRQVLYDCPVLLNSSSYQCVEQSFLSFADCEYQP